jgi:uncharacterized membrane protein YbjE (DUF340 family)
MKGSLIIVSFFALGVLSGIFNWIPSECLPDNISFYALCGLMFSVGLSIGHDPQTIQNFRTLNPRLVLLPIGTILGTLSAALLISLLLHTEQSRNAWLLVRGLVIIHFQAYSLPNIRERN